MIATAWLVVEGVVFVAYRAINHRSFSFSQVSQEVAANASQPESDFVLRGLRDLRMGDFAEVLHPYFGFVADPQQNKREWKISEFGFPLNDLATPVTKRSVNKIIVGVFGGSFSQWVYLSLKALLEARGREIGKEYVVMNFGLGGHKQPQQLIILSYLLAIGGQLDVAINVDGFNEVTLPVFENIPNKVNPYFPRGWDRRTAEAISPSALHLIGLREEAKRAKQHWASSFRNARLYWSPTIFSIWKSRDNYLARRIYSLDQQIQSATATSESYTVRGPRYEAADTAQLYRDLAGVWKRSSLQMKNVCEAEGIRYYHFLQPNQYFARSKPMSPEEARVALNSASPYKDSVERGYPELVAGISELQRLGVTAVDLTQIYSTHPESLYIDDCCHTNTLGSEIVARRILDLAFPK